MKDEVELYPTVKGEFCPRFYWMRQIGGNGELGLAMVELAPTFPNWNTNICHAESFDFDVLWPIKNIYLVIKYFVTLVHCDNVAVPNHVFGGSLKVVPYLHLIASAKR